MLIISRVPRDRLPVSVVGYFRQCIPRGVKRPFNLDKRIPLRHWLAFRIEPRFTRRVLGVHPCPHDLVILSVQQHRLTGCSVIALDSNQSLVVILTLNDRNPVVLDHQVPAQQVFNLHHLVLFIERVPLLIISRVPSNRLSGSITGNFSQRIPSRVKRPFNLDKRIPQRHRLTFCVEPRLTCRVFRIQPFPHDLVIFSVQQHRFTGCSVVTLDSDAALVVIFTLNDRDPVILDYQVSAQ